jgi:hypothetical protein
MGEFVLYSRIVSLAGLTAVLFSQPVSGHTRIKPGSTLTPRSTSSGEKTGPCGATSPTTDASKRTSLIPGQKFTVFWEETIQHPGHFRIAFSPDGQAGFDQNVLLDNIADNQNGQVNYNDPASFHQFSATITIPSKLCETCSLQVIQVMTENPAMPSNYYSCADIRISNTPGSATPKVPPSNSSTGAGGETGAPNTPPAPTNLKVVVKPTT